MPRIASRRPNRAAAPLVVSHRRPSDFKADGLRPFFTYRDLGIRKVTKGGFGAHVIKAVPGKGHGGTGWHTHALGFQMVYVLKGWVRFDYEGHGRVTLKAGSCVYQPPGIRHAEVAHSDDLEMIEITAPAKFRTRKADAPEKAAKAGGRAADRARR
ncbi:MAG: cupin domain-containing protein [Alphaproteobacteria bacterium]|nr:cupin domain-containing protein [Alphaproteobacteria bacterium]